MKFTTGQRVIVKPENLCGATHAGYYGHIVSVQEPDPAHNSYRQPLYDVHLEGRDGKEVASWIQGFNPLAFFEDELEAAD